MNKKLFAAIFILGLVIFFVLSFSSIKEYCYKWKVIADYKMNERYSSLGKVDKIYILNLDRSPKRYEYIKSALEKQNLGIKFERFSAFDGKQSFLKNINTGKIILGADWSSNKYPLNGDYNTICSENYNGDFSPLNLSNITSFPKRAAGELGVWCSHKKIWENIVENNYKAVMVFEDDIKFHTAFKERLAIILDNLPGDADLLYVGSLPSRKRSFDLQYHNHFLNKVVGVMASAEAYIITLDGAKKLLADITSSEVPVDIYMSNQISNKKIIAYAAKPVIVNQRKFIKSSIG